MANKLRVSKSGSGAPTAITPDFLGQIYIDEDTGLRYEATALTEGSWVDKLSLKENVANKKTDLTDNSDTYYPSQKAVKTAVDAKAPLDSPTFATSITGSYLTASEILITDANKKIISAPVATYPSLTELSYVKGVTSGIQSQLGNKAPSASPTLTGTVTLPKAVNIKDTSADHEYQLGVSELAANRTITLPLLTGNDTFMFKDFHKASSAEINTGTEDNKYITPDALAGSNAFTKTVQQYCVEWGTELAVKDGVGYIEIPAECNGMNLISARARVGTAGTTNASTFDIYNVTDSTSMLSSAISIASGATSGTGTVDTSYDDVATGDLIRIDCKTLSTTKPKGLIVTLAFRLA